jgi:hypothetical protein
MSSTTPFAIEHLPIQRGLIKWRLPERRHAMLRAADSNPSSEVDVSTSRFDPVAYKRTTTDQWQTAAEPWHRCGGVRGPDARAGRARCATVRARRVSVDRVPSAVARRRRADAARRESARPGRTAAKDRCSEPVGAAGLASSRVAAAGDESRARRPAGTSAGEWREAAMARGHGAVDRTRTGGRRGIRVRDDAVACGSHAARRGSSDLHPPSHVRRQRGLSEPLSTKAALARGRLLQ